MRGIAGFDDRSNNPQKSKESLFRKIETLNRNYCWSCSILGTPPPDGRRNNNVRPRQPAHAGGPHQHHDVRGWDVGQQQAACYINYLYPYLVLLASFAG